VPIFPINELLSAKRLPILNTLYILGNGFDLWHGLPTRYSDFYVFASTTLDELENYYSFDLHDHEPWHDFEKALGSFDSENFFDHYNEVDISSDHFRPKDLYGLEDELAEQTEIHVSTVKEEFINWVDQIDVSKAKHQKMIFSENSQFITFNYTSTLQSVYGIEDFRVFHIHGRAKANDELFFGHGENVTDPPDFDEHGESTFDMFSDSKRASRQTLYAFKKPVDYILEKNKSYFNQINNIDEVVIIGHSLSTIDQPYFRHIENCLVDARWKVYCYEKEDKKNHTQSLADCGVSKDRIEVIECADL
jgi:hypothetical protein